jgi:hypothetical protein
MPLSRSWLFVTLPVAVIAIVLLAMTALRLARTVRASVVARVPLRPDQRIAFDVAGRLVVHLEGGRLTTRPSGLQLALTADDGTPVPLQRVVVRSRVSSTSSVRVALYDAVLPTAGTYTLHADGVDAPDAQAGRAIVFTRPISGALVGHILALVVLGVALIGSIVVTGLVLSRAGGA